MLLKYINRLACFKIIVGIFSFLILSVIAAKALFAGLHLCVELVEKLAFVDFDPTLNAFLAISIVGLGIAMLATTLVIIKKCLNFAEGLSSERRPVPDKFLLKIAKAKDVSIEEKADIAKYLKDHGTIRFDDLRHIANVHAAAPVKREKKQRPPGAGYQRMMEFLSSAAL